MLWQWPDLRERCLLCGEPGCAVYRGYYTRFVHCPETRFFGRLAIRTAECRRRRKRYSLFPDFLFRYLRISRLSQAALVRQWKARDKDLKAAIDDLVAEMPDEFYLPLSTSYAYLKLSTHAPP